MSDPTYDEIVTYISENIHAFQKYDFSIELDKATEKILEHVNELKKIGKEIAKVKNKNKTTYTNNPLYESWIKRAIDIRFEQRLVGKYGNLMNIVDYITNRKNICNSTHKYIAEYKKNKLKLEELYNTINEFKAYKDTHNLKDLSDETCNKRKDTHNLNDPMKEKCKYYNEYKLAKNVLDDPHLRNRLTPDRESASKNAREKYEKELKDTVKKYKADIERGYIDVYKSRLSEYQKDNVIIDPELTDNNKSRVKLTDSDKAELQNYIDKVPTYIENLQYIDSSVMHPSRWIECPWSIDYPELNHILELKPIIEVIQNPEVPILPASLVLDGKIELYSRDKWNPGNISLDHRNGTFDVAYYDDNNKKKTKLRVEEDKIRYSSDSAKNKPFNLLDKSTIKSFFEKQNVIEKPTKSNIFSLTPKTNTVHYILSDDYDPNTPINKKTNIIKLGKWIGTSEPDEKHPAYEIYFKNPDTDRIVMQRKFQSYPLCKITVTKEGTFSTSYIIGDVYVLHINSLTLLQDDDIIPWAGMVESLSYIDENGYDAKYKPAKYSEDTKNDEIKEWLYYSPFKDRFNREHGSYGVYGKHIQCGNTSTNLKTRLLFGTAEYSTILVDEAESASDQTPKAGGGGGKKSRKLRKRRPSTRRRKSPKKRSTRR